MYLKYKDIHDFILNFPIIVSGLNEIIEIIDLEETESQLNTVFLHRDVVDSIKVLKNENLSVKQ